MSEARVKGVIHAVIVVSEMENALHFYRDLLGLVVRVDIMHDPGPLSRLSALPEPDVRAVILDCPDGSELELAEFRHPRGRDKLDREWPDVGINSVTLQVEHLDDLLDRLASEGFDTLGEVVSYAMEEDGEMRVVYCRAPDDVILTLAEPVTTA